MSNVARDVEMIEVLIQNDFEYIQGNEGGAELLYDILLEGHIGYTNLSTTELEDELVARGLVAPAHIDEM